MDAIDIANVKDAWFSASDAAGNGDEAAYFVEIGAKDACIQRLEWMLTNLESAKSKTVTALAKLKGGA